MEEWIEVYVTFEIETDNGGYIMESYFFQGKSIEILPKTNQPTIKVIHDQCIIEKDIKTKR